MVNGCGGHVLGTRGHWPLSMTKAWHLLQHKSLFWVALGIGLWALLAANAALRRADATLTELGPSRRYWEDTTVAAINLQLGCLRCPTVPWGWRGERVRSRLKVILPRNAGRWNIRSWQFWRTVPLRRFREVRPTGLRRSDDIGRSRLSTMGFMLLGGVAPYLPLWLPVLFALPPFVWLAVETSAAGRPWIGVVTLLLLACSTYVVELLTLAYSAVGFHLVGLLLVVVLSVYGLLSARPTLGGMAARWLVAGVFFAVCTLCRCTVRTFIPALVILAAASAWRAARPPAGRWLRVWGAAALAVALLITPYLVVRPAQEHEAWVGVWEGLGDFDRQKGHAWNDGMARAVLEREGIKIPRPIGPYWNQEETATFRRLVVADVVQDPAWFLGIVGHRVMATILQLKLWPRAAVDGTAFAAHSHPAEGATDVYYRLVSTADVVGWGRWTWEAPLALLWCLGLFPVAVAAWALGTKRLTPGQVVSAAGVPGITAVAAGALPVLVTTASGPETQAFVLVYFLSAAIGVDLATSAARHGRASEHAPPCRDRG
jgi:hypothetical protein